MNAGEQRLHGGVASATALLCAMGLVMVYSITAAHSEASALPAHFVRQCVGALLGLGIVYAASRVPPALWRRAALPVWVASVLILAATHFLGHEVNGARRWLPVFGLSVQPGELAKWSTLLFAAALLAAHRAQRGGADRAARSPARPRSARANPPSLWVALIVGVGVPTLLLFMQPDTSGALVILLMVGILVFVAGAPLRALMATATAGVLALTGAALARPYVLERLQTFLDPWARSEAEGFQIVQSFVAFGRGGAFGVGLGGGRQKLFYLPEAHTDFVLSVVGEELGLIGVALVLGAFAALAIAGFQIAARARARFPLLLAVAMTLFIAVPAAVNAAVVTGLAPATGLALPFVSYGRSALLVSFLAVGVLLSVARHESAERPEASAAGAIRGAERG